MEMDKKILACMLVIGVVSMLLGAGTFSYFSDVEISAGNTFTAGTWDLKTRSLNPDYGEDTTGPSQPHSLTGELHKLASSDDHGYGSKHDWESSYFDDKYLEFGFPDIPAGATVTKVELKFEWQREKDIDAAMLRISGDGGTWKIYDITPLPDEGKDSLVTLDLKADYGIDTATEVNNLVIRFQATHNKENAKTEHDWVQVDVEYQ